MKMKSTPGKELDDMKKSLRAVICSVLAVVIAMGAVPAVTADGANFTKRYEYGDGVFTDVKADDWFYENVSTVYEYGLMNGKGGGRFDPKGNVTVAETLTIAARISSIYGTGSDEFEKTSPWYKTYVDYCAENGILDGIEDVSDIFGEPAARGLFAAILAASLPSEELGEKNRVPDGAIPDVDPGDEYAPSIYALYRAGVTIGSDSKGSFNPENSIKRSEVAAIVTRMIDPSLRQEVHMANLAIYVSPDGSDDSGDGSEGKPFATLTRARDEARKADKSLYSGIDIMIAPGNYVFSETFTLTAEDAGEELCRVRYVGSDGAYLIGGVVLSAADFSPATGGSVQYFPAEARDKIVQIDLTQFGYTKEYVRSTYSSAYIVKNIGLYSNGKIMTVARYPNKGETITIRDGAMLDAQGNVTNNDGNDRPKDPDLAKTYITYVDPEVIDRVLSWHTFDHVNLYGYVHLLWRVDHTYITGVNRDEGYIEYDFPGTSAPATGRSFFLYNIPEELDAPGEYYIDDDAILYYYPTEDFDTAMLSIPLIEKIVLAEGADYTTFENLTVETSHGCGFYVRSNGFTIYKCVICGVSETGVDMTGYDNTISTCHFYDTGGTSAKLKGGDNVNFVYGNNLFYNNVCHDFGILTGGYNGGLELGGFGNTASHNEIYGSNHLGIHWGGAMNVIEYNYLHDLCQIADDMGAIYGGGFEMIGCVVRYNYIRNVGPPTDNRIPEYFYMGCHAVYWDMYNGHNETYGNIIEDVRGAGVAFGNGRVISIHDNLFISCTYCATGICGIYTQAVLGESFMKKKIPEYLTTGKWLELYPEFSTYSSDMHDLVNGWAVPADVRIYDNYCYANKSNTDYRGIVPLTLEQSIYDLNPGIVKLSAQDGNLTIFNSRRGGMPEIADALETASGIIHLTYGDYLEMGPDWQP